jgi:hypothetical protein
MPGQRLGVIFGRRVMARHIIERPIPKPQIMKRGFRPAGSMKWYAREAATIFHVNSPVARIAASCVANPRDWRKIVVA